MKNDVIFTYAYQEFLNASISYNLKHSFPPDDGRTPGRMDFNLSVIPKKEKVHRAELLLFTEQKRGISPYRQLHLFKPKFKNGDRILAFYKKIRNERKGYVKLDITDLIKDWKVNGVENSSMIVEIDRKANDLNSVHTRRRRDISHEEWQQKRPLLIVYSVSPNNKRIKTPAAPSRKRRNVRVSTDMYMKAINIPKANETHQKVKRETCRLSPYSLDFKDFGWDEWIIAPNSYDLNFCSGACPKPLGPHFNTTNHAVIQNAVLGINKQLVPQLCCVPTTFKDQTFLFLDSNGKLLLKTPVEMIALGCGCH